MRTVIETVPKVLPNPNDISARATMQWASIVALNGWAQPGDGWTPMHQLGHVLSAQYDIPHGASLALVMPAWMRYFYSTRMDRYQMFAERVFDVNPLGKSPEEVVLEGINRFEGFLNSIKVPTHLSQIGVTEDAVDFLTDQVVKISFGSDGKLFSRPPATRADVKAVFTLAL
jgi:alcohol dehydrogenase YqhD (iron-dependent ADH family)